MQRPPSSRVGETVIQRMHSNFESLDGAKSNADRNNIHTVYDDNMNSKKMDFLVNLISAWKENPVQAVETEKDRAERKQAEKGITAASRAHTIDLLLRRLVGGICKRDRTAVGAASRAKKIILEEAKHCVLSDNEVVGRMVELVGGGHEYLYEVLYEVK